MVEFNDFDLEIQDEKQSEPEHFNGSITTAGSPVSLQLTSGKAIQWFFLSVPSVRDQSSSNGIHDAIKFNIDGTSTYVTIMSGESIFVPGLTQTLKLDTNDDGTDYEVILWGGCND